MHALEPLFGAKVQLAHKNSTLAMQAREKKYKPWSREEQERFAKLYKEYGWDFESYVGHFEGRSALQIKSFFYNAQKRRQRYQARDAREQQGCLRLIVFDE